jgi:CDGSH-type Zn-finger protein
MIKAKCSQKMPYVQKGEKKKYAWCACGESTNQPFCDGSHKGTGFSPILVDNEKEGNIAWCGCKATSTAPFCDGTHSKL